MTIAVLLIWLVSILPSSMLGKLTEKHLKFIDFAHEQAIQNGINPHKFIKLIHCESQFEDGAIGDEGNAYGILQFWKGTFNKFSKLYNLKGDYRNPYDQISLAAKAISDNNWFHWKNCGVQTGYSNKFPF